MMQLYTTPLPEATMPGLSARQRSQLAEAGALNSDKTIVEQLSSDAKQTDLRGRVQFADPNTRGYSKMIAGELEELAKSSLEGLPLFRADRDWDGSGYYEIESANTDPAHPNRDDVYEYEVTVTKVGTTADHHRTIVTSPRDAIANPFDASDEPAVTAPATARKVQWVNPRNKSDRELATAAETRQSSGVDIDIYPVADNPFGVADPILAYEVDYADDMAAGSIVYDTRGHATKISSDNARRWRVVHATDHDVENRLVLTNGRIQLSLDEQSGEIGAKRWDGSAWDRVALSQPAGVSLLDINITEIGLAHDDVQLSFDVDGALYALDASVQRGLDDVLFTIPPTESGAIPQDLEDWLAPIASGVDTDMQPTKSLLSR